MNPKHACCHFIDEIVGGLFPQHSQPINELTTKQYARSCRQRDFTLNTDLAETYCRSPQLLLLRMKCIGAKIK